MRGLTIVVCAVDPPRFRTALTLAMAHAALGARAHIYLDSDAVALFVVPPAIDEAIGLGVRFTLCQTGLAAAGIDAAALPPGVETGGPIQLIAELDEDRLIVV